MKILNFADKVIEYSFYLLFFLVPLVFSSKTSELFELNKMWLTFALVILITSSWIAKMVVLKKFYLQKTPLDIPILLFLISQIISTINSLDSYTSLWGYYSRFNGGLLSIFSYVILYYAFVSNFDLKTKTKELVKRIILITLASGAIVALWGLPSHFGYDPTCLIFRQTFDVSCWTSDFQPKVRIFSTLGQPDWLGAYLAILAPISIAFALSKNLKKIIIFSLLSFIFYIDILFTKSRATLIAFWGSMAFFAGSFYLLEVRKKVKNIKFKALWPHVRLLTAVLVLLFVSTFVISSPIQLKTDRQTPQSQNQTPGTFSTGGGGTESGKIRLLVWGGAFNIWRHYPIFGSGVETFAFAYYKYRPVAHNLTSEWNYLYNKAHNEYLNYLATTGIFGFGTYLAMIGFFLYKTFNILKKKRFDSLIFALLAGYISILVGNFFGFSVVIVNIYFFLIPAFVLILSEGIKSKEIFVYNFGESQQGENLSLLQKLDIFVVCLIAFYLLFGLFNFWLADQAYALGSNLSRSGQYDKAFTALEDAVSKTNFEPTFKDELASNDSILAVSILSSLPQDPKKASQEATLAEALAKEAIVATTEVTGEHPNNVVFWKTKTRVFYTLSQADPKYLKLAIDAIKKAQELAPTDANVSYNLGLLYGQQGDIKKAIETLNQTVKLKPNYTTAYYALGLFYRELATNNRGAVINQDMEQKAEEQMNIILKIDPNNTDAKEALKLWSGTKF